MHLLNELLRWLTERETALDVFVLVVTVAGNLGGVASMADIGPTAGLLKPLVGGDMLALVYLGLRIV
jgi:hypothetical protein